MPFTLYYCRAFTFPTHPLLTVKYNQEKVLNIAEPQWRMCFIFQAAFRFWQVFYELTHHHHVYALIWLLCSTTTGMNRRSSSLQIFFIVRKLLRPDNYMKLLSKVFILYKESRFIIMHDLTIIIIRFGCEYTSEF